MTKRWFWLVPLMAACGASNDHGTAAIDGGEAPPASDAGTTDADRADDDASADQDAGFVDAGEDARIVRMPASIRTRAMPVCPKTC